MRANEDKTFKLYGDLIDILGFRERHDQNGDPLDTPGEGRSVRSSKNVASMSFPAETVVDLRRGFESLYVYSGIVEPRIVGDKIAPRARNSTDNGTTRGDGDSKFRSRPVHPRAES